MRECGEKYFEAGKIIVNNSGIISHDKSVLH
jgi:hypothetical protein